MCIVLVSIIILLVAYSSVYIISILINYYNALVHAHNTGLLQEMLCVGAHYDVISLSQMKPANVWPIHHTWQQRRPSSKKWHLGWWAVLIMTQVWSFNTMGSLPVKTMLVFFSLFLSLLVSVLFTQPCSCAKDVFCKSYFGYIITQPLGNRLHHLECTASNFSLASICIASFPS